MITTELLLDGLGLPAGATDADIERELRRCLEPDDIVMSTVVPLGSEKGKRGDAPDYKMINRGNGRGDIHLYGLIGISSDNFFGIDGITAKQFADDLKKLGDVKQINLRINSDGGVVDDARAIYNMLVQHPAEVTTYIDGIAASAASFVAMAGKRIDIAEGAFVMIHNARGGARGEAKDLRQCADVMDSYTNQIRKTYADRTKQSDAQLKTWMDAETYFTAAEAKQYGFVDTITGNMKAVACVSRLSAVRNLPAALRQNRARASIALSAMGIARK